MLFNCMRYTAYINNIYILILECNHIFTNIVAITYLLISLPSIRKHTIQKA
uniref:Uncharacterized protein n=1 Tax=Octopus bimaculoides TaxID=37653 RepID=A0A0L8H5P1_OCTBM